MSTEKIEKLLRAYLSSKDWTKEEIDHLVQNSSYQYNESEAVLKVDHQGMVQVFDIKGNAVLVLRKPLLN